MSNKNRPLPSPATMCTQIGESSVLPGLSPMWVCSNVKSSAAKLLVAMAVLKAAYSVAKFVVLAVVRWQATQ